MHKNIVHLAGFNDNYSPDISSQTLHWQKFRWTMLSCRAQLMKTDDMLSSQNLVLSIGR